MSHTSGTCGRRSTPLVIHLPNNMSKTVLWSISFDGFYYVFEKKTAGSFNSLLELIKALCDRLYKPGDGFNGWIEDICKVLKTGAMIEREMSDSDFNFLMFLIDRENTERGASYGKFYGRWESCDRSFVFRDHGLSCICMIFATMGEPATFTITVPPEFTISATPTTDFTSEIERVAVSLECAVERFLSEGSHE